MVLWDNFEGPILDTNKWSILTSPGVSVTQTGGQIKVTGTTSSSTQWNASGIRAVPTFITDFAAESEFSIVAQSPTAQTNWKGYFGFGIHVHSYANPNKATEYWNNAWYTLGDSTLDQTTFSNKKVTQSFISPGNAQHYEEGVLKATRTGLSNTSSKPPTFSYGPDVPGGTSIPFDVRYDNIRVRKFVGSDGGINVQRSTEEQQ